MQYVDAIVGNSSSGLIEASSHIGTLNIGDRQKVELQKVLLIVDIRNEKFLVESKNIAMD